MWVRDRFGGMIHLSVRYSYTLEDLSDSRLRHENAELQALGVKVSCVLDDKQSRLHSEGISRMELVGPVS